MRTESGAWNGAVNVGSSWQIGNGVSEVPMDDDPEQVARVILETTFLVASGRSQAVPA